MLWGEGGGRKHRGMCKWCCIITVILNNYIPIYINFRHIKESVPAATLLGFNASDLNTEVCTSLVCLQYVCVVRARACMRVCCVCSVCVVRFVCACVTLCYRDC